MSRGQRRVRTRPRLPAIHWTKLCRGEIVFSPAAAPADPVRFVRTQRAALLPAAVQHGPAAEFRVATIKDVAREAGVSIATVSRVFNDTGLVSAATEHTVREVAARLNYWPN